MSDAILLIFAVLCGGVSVLLNGVYTLVGRVGHYEVRRKAQLHQPGARSLYILHQRGYEPLIGLAIWQMFFTALFIVCLINLLPVAFSVIIATVFLTIGNAVIASFYLQRYLRKYMDKLWRLLSKMLGLVRPVSRLVAKPLQKRFGKDKPTIYSREHLLAILEAHGSSAISEVDSKEITIIKAALQFQTKQIRALMKPVDDLPIIHRDTAVGPILLDELHNAQYSWFPVREKAQRHIAGVVSLHDLRQMRSGGIAGSKLREDIAFVNEESTLLELVRFYEETHAMVFLVTNRFDDVVGVITLDIVINQLLGVNHQVRHGESVETVVE